MKQCDVLLTEADQSFCLQESYFKSDSSQVFCTVAPRAAHKQTSQDILSWRRRRLFDSQPQSGWRCFSVFCLFALVSCRESWTLGATAVLRKEPDRCRLWVGPEPHTWFRQKSQTSRSWLWRDLASWNDLITLTRRQQTFSDCNFQTYSLNLHLWK